MNRCDFFSHGEYNTVSTRWRIQPVGLAGAALVGLAGAAKLMSATGSKKELSSRGGSWQD